MLLLVLLGLLFGAFARPASAAPAESRVLPQLQQAAAAKPNQDFRVIVTRIGRDTRADEKVRALGGARIKNLRNGAFVATIKGRAIGSLGADPSVKYVAPDAPMMKLAAVDPANLATTYPAAAGGAGLWSSLTGAGVGVAILDTGITSAGEESATTRGDWLDANGNSRIVAQARFNAATTTMDDGYGHGTHVAGIVAGNSWHSSDPAARGRYIGIAPEAQLINVKVSDDAGVTYISDVVDAIEWVIANRQTYNIRVMNLSLVSSVAESYTTSILAAAVERAWFSGILVVVAAGNSGPDTMYYPPANDPFVITVGASDPLGTPAQSDDGMAPWSSYGTTQDGVSKPDLVAPGRFIIAPLASSRAVLPGRLPDRIVGGGYLRLSGTSMAAPVVAGAAALIFQAHPEWTNDQVKWLLMHGATQLGPQAAPLPGQGAGEINIAAAASYEGIPSLANQGLSISQQLLGPEGETTYTSSNWSASSWSASSWSASNWSASNWSASNWSASNWSSANWSSLSETDVE